MIKPSCIKRGAVPGHVIGRIPTSPDCSTLSNGPYFPRPGRDSHLSISSTLSNSRKIYNVVARKCLDEIDDGEGEGNLDLENFGLLALNV
jgi:hypothetical protein